MLTIISGNNRNGYPYALNKVGDIFQCGIPPFQTEGLIDLGKASQKEAFSLAGSLSLIFSSIKATATGSAGVTVSMTSEDSAGYANLSSPKSASAKSRHHQIPMPEVTVTSRNTINGLASAHMVGVCADNHLNEKANSGFVQTAGKEKGPRPALRVMQLLTCEEANELHHNLPLQATSNLSYSRSVARQWAAGFSILNTEADISRFKVRFFCVRNLRCAPIMVGRNGGAFGLAGFFCAGMLTPIRLATSFSIEAVRLQNLTEEATAMVATTQTRPEFIDTYWIIPEYETTPYGKVSFTRQDRRTFIALFKDSRIIWAGRQPVQGRVNITPPSTSTITEIVTVQGVAHV
ncbi:hypothetical protein ACWWJF_15790 [Symbiopectobacterium sp. Eva_TO]